MIYLDNAATTLIKPVSVERAVRNAMETCASPGRGGHRPAMRSAEVVFRCRERAAELFHVPDPAQVVFTMNATHALNLAIHSLAKRGTHVLISGYEHNSVTRPLAMLGAEIRLAEAPVFDRTAQLDAFMKELDWAEVVICTMVSNVFGFILPVNELAEYCREKGVPLIVDASQAAGIMDVNMESLGAAFIAMPGHKGLFGPQGTGLLLCAQAGEPLISGGSGSDSILQQMPEFLPDRLEAGTHNVPGIAGLLAGIEYVLETGTDTVAAHEECLRRLMLEELAELPGLEVFAGEPGSQSGVVSFRFQGMSCEEAAEKLAMRGICLRSGLHCAPYAHKSAGTLDTGTLRASFSPFVSADMLHSACETIRELLQTVA